MAVRPVLKMGNPVLRASNRALQISELKEPWFIQLLIDMYQTMKATQGIGLAAPQIGENLKLAIIDLDADEEKTSKKKVPQISFQQILNHPTLKVFINPVISVVDSKSQQFWEGCLSLPGLHGLVERPRKVSVRYTNLQGQQTESVFEDFESTVIQHELDHLSGVLYIDRITDMTKMAYTPEFKEFILPHAKEGVMDEEASEDGPNIS